MDRSFSNVIQWVAEESLRLQHNPYPDEGSSLSSLRDTKSILQTLVVGERDLGAFSAIESDLDGEHSVQSNYRSSYDTREGPCDDDLENIRTLELETTKPTSPVNETGSEQQGKEMDEQGPTPPHNQSET